MAGFQFTFSRKPNPLNVGAVQRGHAPVQGQAQGASNVPGAHQKVGTSAYGAGGSGGASIPRLGPTRKSSAGAVVENRWLGLNQAVAPARLTGLESPDLINMTTWQVAGSLSTRFCRGKCAEAATKATGVCVLPTSFIDSDGVRNVVLVSASGSAETLEISKLTLPAKPERALDFSPEVTLTSPSAGNIRVALSALTSVGGVESVVCCWSTDGYPTSPWAVDASRNTAGRDEAAWYGVTSFQNDSDVTGEVTATGLVYVTVWIVGRLGMSQAWHGTVSVTIS